MLPYVIKSNGERELFSSEKFKRSLHRAGILEETAEMLLQDVIARPDLDSTYKIYDYAFNKLKAIDRAQAARYSLKNALYELGPEGFLFERFMAELFKAQGFTTRVDQIVPGKCVNHEVDIIMKKSDTQYMAECKFHTRRGLKSDVKVALYVSARYHDIKEQWEQSQNPAYRCDRFWLLTNTQFTADAIQYGECMGITMLGWAYPDKGNIAQLIDELGLHPLTSLTSLTIDQKRAHLDNNTLFAWELGNHQDILQQIGLSELQVRDVLEEEKALRANQITPN